MELYKLLNSEDKFILKIKFCNNITINGYFVGKHAVRLQSMLLFDNTDY